MFVPKPYLLTLGLLLLVGRPAAADFINGGF